MTKVLLKDFLMQHLETKTYGAALQWRSKQELEFEILYYNRQKEIKLFEDWDKMKPRKEKRLGRPKTFFNLALRSLVKNKILEKMAEENRHKVFRFTKGNQKKTRKKYQAARAPEVYLVEKIGNLIKLKFLANNDGAKYGADKELKCENIQFNVDNISPNNCDVISYKEIDNETNFAEVQDIDNLMDTAYASPTKTSFPECFLNDQFENNLLDDLDKLNFSEEEERIIKDTPIDLLQEHLDAHKNDFTCYPI